MLLLQSALQAGAPMNSDRGRHGFYSELGETISSGLASKGIAVTVASTPDSYLNLEQLEQGKVQLCIAQSDFAYEAVAGKRPFAHPLKEVALIGPLLAEQVHPKNRSWRR